MNIDELNALIAGGSSKMMSDKAINYSTGRQKQVVSEESKAKMSASATGRILSAETRAKVSQNRSGIPMSEETKAILSKQRTGTKKDPAVTAQMLKTRSENAIKRNLESVPAELRDRYTAAYQFRLQQKATLKELSARFNIPKAGVLENLLIAIVRQEAKAKV